MFCIVFIQEIERSMPEVIKDSTFYFFPGCFPRFLWLSGENFFIIFFGKLGEIVGMTMLKLFYHNFLKNQIEKKYTQIISRQTELFNKIYVSNFLVEIENGSSKYD